MIKQLKKPSIPPPERGFAGREVLAELISSADPTQRFLEQALQLLGLKAEIPEKEKKSLVTVYKVVIDERERLIAIGNNIVESSDPVGEIQKILRMYGLGAL